MHARDARLLLSRNIFKKTNASSTYDMGRISVFLRPICWTSSMPSCEAIKEKILWKNPAQLYGLA
jgi:hypothetical protein